MSDPFISGYLILHKGPEALDKENLIFIGSLVPKIISKLAKFICDYLGQRTFLNSPFDFIFEQGVYISSSNFP